MTRQTAASDWRVYPRHEPSSWLRTVATQVLRRVDREGMAGLADEIVAPVGRTGPTGSREDYTCDRCRRYDRDGLIPFTWRARPNVTLIGGLCTACAALEFGKAS